MCNVHAIRKYGVDLPVSFLGYTSTSCRSSVSSTLLFLYLAEHSTIMKKIKLYIAASIDGYIAQGDGSLDWLMKYPVNTETNYGYDDFFDSIDTVVMGGQTYRDILDIDVVWPYKDKTTYVITRNSQESNGDIHFISENIIKAILELRKKTGTDIWLVGGGKIVSMLLSHNLIDEMIITTIPVLLGNGIPLFPSAPNESVWEVQRLEKYDNNVTQTHYAIKK